jgi:hypothetical protein
MTDTNPSLAELDAQWRETISSRDLAGAQRLLAVTPKNLVLFSDLPLSYLAVLQGWTEGVELFDDEGWDILQPTRGSRPQLGSNELESLIPPLVLCAGILGNERLFLRMAQKCDIGAKKEGHFWLREAFESAVIHNQTAIAQWFKTELQREGTKAEWNIGALLDKAPTREMVDTLMDGLVILPEAHLLIEAAHAGRDVFMLEALHAHGAPLAAGESTALHFACLNHDIKAIGWLLEHGADPNAYHRAQRDRSLFGGMGVGMEHFEGLVHPFESLWNAQAHARINESKRDEVNALVTRVLDALKAGGAKGSTPHPKTGEAVVFRLMQTRNNAALEDFYALLLAEPDIVSLDNGRGQRIVHHVCQHGSGESLLKFLAALTEAHGADLLHVHDKKGDLPVHILARRLSQSRNADSKISEAMRWMIEKGVDPRALTLPHHEATSGQSIVELAGWDDPQTNLPTHLADLRGFVLADMERRTIADKVPEADNNPDFPKRL